MFQRIHFLSFLFFGFLSPYESVTMIGMSFGNHLFTCPSQNYFQSEIGGNILIFQSYLFFMISHLFITFYTTIVSALERTSNFACTFFSEPIFSYSISWGYSCIGEGSRFRLVYISHPSPLPPPIYLIGKCLIFSFFLVKAYICKLFTFKLSFWWGETGLFIAQCVPQKKNLIKWTDLPTIPS